MRALAKTKVWQKVEYIYKLEELQMKVNLTPIRRFFPAAIFEENKKINQSNLNSSTDKNTNNEDQPVDLDSYYQAPFPHLGMPIPELKIRDNNRLILFEACLEFLNKKHSLTTSGIFRINSGKIAVHQFLKCLESINTNNFSKYSMSASSEKSVIHFNLMNSFNNVEIKPRVLSEAGTENSLSIVEEQEDEPTIETQNSLDLSSFSIGVEHSLENSTSLEVTNPPEIKNIIPSNVSAKFHNQPITYNVDNVHIVAGILKIFLKELPVSLLNPDKMEVIQDFYYDVIKKDSKDSKNPNKNVNLTSFLTQTFPENATEILQIFRLLQKVQNFQHVNKMSAKNLATVFGPILCVPSCLSQMTKRLFMLIEFYEFVIVNLD